jgi:NAD(P)-dependent dehydrogenase (short-subunit alcohol dehydrogenase family)
MKRVMKGMILALGVAGAARIARRMALPSFAGRTILITGGSRGLGLTLARRFADEGANLVIVARTEEDLSEARLDLERRGARVLTVTADLTKEAEARRVVKETVDNFLHLDVVINNAGVIQVGPEEHMTDEDYREAMDIHFWGVHYLIQSALPHLRRSDMARLVNISSVGGEIAVPHMAPYVASKFALVGYSDTLRAELARVGVRVTTVSPGLMRTGSHINAMFKGQRAREYAWFSVLAGNPLLSTSAEAAALRIVRACREGRPSLVITLPAKVASVANAVAPNLTSRALELTNALLPAPSRHDGQESRPGREVEHKAPEVLTHMADKEVVAHNE